MRVNTIANTPLSWWKRSIERQTPSPTQQLKTPVCVQCTNYSYSEITSEKLKACSVMTELAVKLRVLWPHSATCWSMCILWAAQWDDIVIEFEYLSLLCLFLVIKTGFMSQSQMLANKPRPPVFLWLFWRWQRVRLLRHSQQTASLSVKGSCSSQYIDWSGENKQKSPYANTTNLTGSIVMGAHSDITTAK